MRKRSTLFFIAIVSVGVLLLAGAWCIEGFSDAYVTYVYPAFLETYGRLTGLLPFSIGEFMLYAAVTYVALTLILLIARLVLKILKRDFFRLLNRVNLKCFAWILAIVFFIQVANCFVMYQTTPLYGETNYEPATVSELFELRERMVKRANELAPTFERGENGDIVYGGDMKETAVKAMQNLGELSSGLKENGSDKPLVKPLSRLRGYYSKPKGLLKSDFFTQQYIKGYFFPFSLEANYNTLMGSANFPDTFCHEMSHLKGFLLEDEASFIAYLACVNSGDTFFEYSGLLNAISYINIEVSAELEADASLYDKFAITGRSDLVKHDMIFVSEEKWQEVEADALISTEVTSKASETFLDTNLTVNGVSDGVKSYSRIVDLLIKYYFRDGKTYDR